MICNYFGAEMCETVRLVIEKNSKYNKKKKKKMGKNTENKFLAGVRVIHRAQPGWLPALKMKLIPMK